MKVNVKGLVFVGAAAAILLSAGAANAAKTARYPNTTEGNAAAAADAGVVTSKRYSDEKYEYVADKAVAITEGEGGNATSDDAYPSVQAVTTFTNNKFQQKVGGSGSLTANAQNASLDKLVTATSTAGTVVYTPIVKTDVSAAASNVTGSWKNSNTTGSDYAVPSEKSVITALNAVEASINQNEVAESTYIGVTPDTTTGLGTVISIKDGMIQTSNTTQDNVNTTANADKLATAQTVQRKQTATAVYQVSKDAEWESVDSAIDTTTGDYLMKDTARTDGGVRLKIDPSKVVSTEAAVTSGTTQLVTASGVKGYSVANQFGAAESAANAGDSADKNKVLTIDGAGRVTKADYAMQKSTTALTTANAADTTVPTTKTVTDFVTTAMGGYTLPTMNNSCNDPDAHCALVTSYDSTNGLQMAWVPMAQ